MVKRNLDGSVQNRRSARQLAEDILRQLSDPTVCDWISNGEDAVHGRLIRIRRTAKGLRLSLDTGRSVVWKVGSAALDALGPMLIGCFGWERVEHGSIVTA